MSVIQKVLALIEDKKDSITDNEYLDICNWLLQKYKEEKVTQQKQYDILYVRIEYVNIVGDIILEDTQTLPFQNMIVKYNANEEHKIDIIDILIKRLVFDNLKQETYHKIIEKYGGTEQGLTKVQEYIEDYSKFEELSESEKCKIIAYHIIDHIIVEFDHITEFVPDNALDANMFIKICKELLPI